MVLYLNSNVDILLYLIALQKYSQSLSKNPDLDNFQQLNLILILSKQKTIQLITFDSYLLPAIHTASSVLLFHAGIFIKCICKIHHRMKNKEVLDDVCLLYYDIVTVEQ